MKLRRLAAATWLILALSSASRAHAGVVLQPVNAPEWKVSEWVQGPLTSLGALRGRIVLIEFIQLRCPASTGFAVPLFERLHEKYAGRDVVVVALHSVFEDHAAQTPELLRSFVAEQGIRHAVGIDAYDRPQDREPATLQRFNAGGTPHIVVLDRAGQVRFSHFGVFDGATLEAFVDRLLKQP